MKGILRWLNEPVTFPRWVWFLGCFILGVVGNEATKVVR